MNWRNRKTAYALEISGMISAQYVLPRFMFTIITYSGIIYTSNGMIHVLSTR